MSNYIFLSNFYLGEIQSTLQDFFNTNFDKNSSVSAEILMKNSRTYYIHFNEELSCQEIIDLLSIFNRNKPINDRFTTIEGYFKHNDLMTKYYFLENNLFYINSKNETFKIDNDKEVFQSTNIKFNSIQIPSKGLHKMGIISYYIPLKKWWKIW